SGNCELFFAIADLRRRTTAVTGKRERIDQLTVRRIDENLVANGHRAIDAAGFLRTRERELFDAQFENGHETRLEPRGIDGVEHLRFGEFRPEDFLDQVLVRGAEVR